MSGNRTAIVTGGSGGIGREICRRLALDGYRVVVHYGNNRPPAEQVVREITDSGGIAQEPAPIQQQRQRLTRCWFQCRTNWEQEGSPSTVSALGPQNQACSLGVAKNGRNSFATFRHSNASVTPVIPPLSFHSLPAKTPPG